MEKKRKWLVTLALGLAACGGISAEDRSGKDSNSASNDGQAGSGARGPSTPGDGETPADGSGGSTSSGGAVPSSGGHATAGGSTSLGGAGAGSIDTGDAGAGGEAEVNCYLQELTAGTRCKNAASRAQGPNLERAEGITTHEECQEACLGRADCHGVMDYLDEGPQGLGCSLYSSTCDQPSVAVWAEEDAGKDYVKRACSEGECEFEYLGHFRRCEEAGWPNVTEVEGATGLDDCFAACAEDETCTAVTDYFWLDDYPGCYLLTTSCGGAEMLPFGDPGLSYEKRCD